MILFYISQRFLSLSDLQTNDLVLGLTLQCLQNLLSELFGRCRILPCEKVTGVGNLGPGRIP